MCVRVCVCVCVCSYKPAGLEGHAGGRLRVRRTTWLETKGPYQCHYMSLSFVNTGHIGYINPMPFSPIEILCLFTFYLHSINTTEST